VVLLEMGSCGAASFRRLGYGAGHSGKGGRRELDASTIREGGGSSEAIMLHT